MFFFSLTNWLLCSHMCSVFTARCFSAQCLQGSPFFPNTRPTRTPRLKANSTWQSLWRLDFVGATKMTLHGSWSQLPCLQIYEFFNCISRAETWMVVSWSLCCRLPTVFDLYSSSSPVVLLFKLRSRAIVKSCNKLKETLLIAAVFCFEDLI